LTQAQGRRRLTRSQVRKITIIIVLILLLSLIGVYYAYYQATHKLAFNIAPVTEDTIDPPQFLYAFSGTTIKLQRPVGVMVDGDNVYTPDSNGRQVLVFAQDGKFKRSFGASQTIVPLNVAKNPKNNELYVTDRRMRTIFRYDQLGRYLGEFKPNLPKEQLPTFNTAGFQWAPVALAFAPDGTLYVTELLNGHRMLIFAPDGTFKKSVGSAGQVDDAKKSPGLFLFPNGITYHKGLVYVTDSNNRRVQVFDKQGNFKTVVVTEGLPRGIAFLNRFPFDKANAQDRYVVVDTLAHDGTLWTAKGDKILAFGQQGFADGEFNYPNGAAVGSRNKIFIADTSNGRIQVWGWPNQVSPVPIPNAPNWWPLCLAPLLLLPLLLLLRRKRFFVTRDFVLEMLDFEQADLMPGRRRKWIVTEEDYEALKDTVLGDVDMAKLLNPEVYSESDVRELIERLEIDEPTAIAMSLAQRAKVFCTVNLDYRRLAKTLELDVVNREEYLERFAKRQMAKASADTTGSGNEE
jgi:DNA-binding beta-propeller fold protein YncE